MCMCIDLIRRSAEIVAVYNASSSSLQENTAAPISRSNSISQGDAPKPVLTLQPVAPEPVAPVPTVYENPRAVESAAPAAAGTEAADEAKQVVYSVPIRRSTMTKDTVPKPLTAAWSEQKKPEEPAAAAAPPSM